MTCNEDTGNVVKVKRLYKMTTLACIEFHNDYVILIGVFCK